MFLFLYKELVVSGPLSVAKEQIWVKDIIKDRITDNR